MAVKINANTVIDNSGLIPWADLISKPAGLVEVITLAGTLTYYIVAYNSGTRTLTFTKSL